MLSSMNESPEKTVPSAAIFSPGFTDRMSPGRICDILTVFSPSGVMTDTVFGRSPARRRIALEVSRLALSSSSLPMSMNVMIMAEDSK